MLRKYGLMLLVLLQLAIIAGMLILALLPLLTGSPVRLEVTLRNPRDLFRGNYVALNYDINQVSLDSLPNDLPPDAKYQFGDRLYLELRPDGETYVAAGLWLSPPDGEKLFLQGVVAQRTFLAGRRVIWLNYGIESYFTDPEEALLMEEQLRNRPDANLAPPMVTVMVDGRGRARIKEIDYHKD